MLQRDVEVLNAPRTTKRSKKKNKKLALIWENYQSKLNGHSDGVKRCAERARAWRWRVVLVVWGCSCANSRFPSEQIEQMLLTHATSHRKIQASPTGRLVG